MDENKLEVLKSDLRLGSFSNERWAKEMDVSEWIIRYIVSKLNDGRGASFKEIHEALRKIIGIIVTNQYKKPYFLFSFNLVDWLEFEAETDRMNVVWHKDKPIYKLSDYIDRLLERRNNEINQLIEDVSGVNLETILK